MKTPLKPTPTQSSKSTTEEEPLIIKNSGPNPNITQIIEFSSVNKIFLIFKSFTNHFGQ